MHSFCSINEEDDTNVLIHPNLIIQARKNKEKALRIREEKREQREKTKLPKLLNLLPLLSEESQESEYLMPTQMQEQMRSKDGRKKRTHPKSSPTKDSPKRDDIGKQKQQKHQQGGAFTSTPREQLEMVLPPQQQLAQPIPMGGGSMMMSGDPRYYQGPQQVHPSSMMYAGGYTPGFNVGVHPQPQPMHQQPRYQQQQFNPGRERGNRGRGRGQQQHPQGRGFPPAQGIGLGQMGSQPPYPFQTANMMMAQQQQQTTIPRATTIHGQQQQNWETQRYCHLTTSYGQK
jgi:hypothetical protein